MSSAKRFQIMRFTSNQRLSRVLAPVALLLALLWPGVMAAKESVSSKPHWAFAPVIRAQLPPVRNASWGRTAIDRFILARLERERIRPAPEADRATLLRRLSLDLIGLPPTVAELDDFLSDHAPGACERQVDRLLASPHFGERWGRHWLDLARYADSSGYQVDRERPWAWVYRDWVISSLNRDQPFDEFTVEQLAGDLIYEAQNTAARKPELLAASGFHRMALMNHEDGVDAAEFTAKAKVDRVATTGIAWLGLTLGCAECHSHKYDPISQREFYQLYAFFNAAEEHDASLPDGRTAYTFRQSTKPAPTFVHVRGDFLRHGDEVHQGVLQAVSWTAADESHVSGNEDSSRFQNRLDLARWIASPENPLTARVAVNQMWLRLFGRGLVATTEDFGVRGEAPSHPELLDWLATEFMRAGWSRKHIIRLLVNSAAYRQSSHTRPELLSRDPDNRLLARQGRFRLEAEILRDSALSVSGRLNPQIGGRSFRPHMEDDMKFLGTAGAWVWTDDTGPVLQRRSLYIYSQRTVPHPLLPTFDQAGPSEPCTRRERSDNPLQALTLLNNANFVDCASALALQMEPDPAARPAEQIRAAFRRCLARDPNRDELRRLETLFQRAAAVSPQDARLVIAQTLLNLDEFLTRE
jgi:hypothetical protein